MKSPEWLGRNPARWVIILHESVECCRRAIGRWQGGRATIDAISAFRGMKMGLDVSIPIPRWRLMRATCLIIGTTVSKIRIRSERIKADWQSS
jgi:hypothetical protein